MRRPRHRLLACWTVLVWLVPAAAELALALHVLADHGPGKPPALRGLLAPAHGHAHGPATADHDHQATAVRAAAWLPDEGRLSPWAVAAVTSVPGLLEPPQARARSRPPPAAPTSEVPRYRLTCSLLL